MYISSRHLEFNIIGCFHVLPPAHCLTLNGGLYISNICEDRLIFYRIGPDGNLVHGEMDAFFIIFHADSNQLIASCPESNSQKNIAIQLTSTVTITTSPSYYFTSIGSLLADESINIVRLKPLPPPLLLPSSLSSTQPTQSVFVSNLLKSTGIFVGSYGPHGLEILHVHITPLLDVTIGDGASETADDMHNSGGSMTNIQLKGLKLTGDPNVPADQLSFQINVQDLLNPVDAISSDPRPIVVYDMDTRHSKILSIRDRLSRIVFWARGFGQINRHPPVWDPEWVGCSYILYCEPLRVHHRVRFTIVWDDEEYHSRHAIDFFHLPRGDAPLSHVQLLENV